MDDYLAGLPPAQKAALERVRALVGGLVPDAEEGGSYGVPAFIYAGRIASATRVARSRRPSGQPSGEPTAPCAPPV